MGNLINESVQLISEIQLLVAIKNAISDFEEKSRIH